jgi:hypothetical protein
MLFKVFFRAVKESIYIYGLSWRRTTVKFFKGLLKSTLTSYRGCSYVLVFLRLNNRF